MNCMEVPLLRCRQAEGACAFKYDMMSLYAAWWERLLADGIECACVGLDSLMFQIESKQQHVQRQF